MAIVIDAAIPVDTAQSAKQNIIDLINDANNTEVNAADLIFDDPRTVVGQSKNLTVIQVDGNQQKGYAGQVTMYYNRINLSSLSVLTDGQIAITNSADNETLLSAIEKKINAVSGQIQLSDSYQPGDVSIDVVSKTGSLLYYGQTTLARVQPKVPGPDTPLGESNGVSFYGEIAPSDFISGQWLADHFGITEGSAYNGDPAWLKFDYQGKTLFIPKKTIWRGISWKTLYDKGLIYGVDGPGDYPPDEGSVNQNQTVEIAGSLFRVRCMTVTQYVSAGDYEPGGEFIALFEPLLAGNALGRTYSYDDLGMVDNHELFWGQQQMTYQGQSRYAAGGYHSNNNYTLRTLGFVYTAVYYWRPVLELVQS